MTTIELDPLVRAFVKTLEESNIVASAPGLTGTQFECFSLECRRVVLDSLDVEPGTVICVGGWEAMRVVGNGERGELVWVGFDGRMYTHEGFADIVRSARDVVRVVHCGVI